MNDYHDKKAVRLTLTGAELDIVIIAMTTGITNNGGRMTKLEISAAETVLTEFCRVGQAIYLGACREKSLEQQQMMKAVANG